MYLCFAIENTPYSGNVTFEITWAEIGDYCTDKLSVSVPVNDTCQTIHTIELPSLPKKGVMVWVMLTSEAPVLFLALH